MTDVTDADVSIRYGADDIADALGSPRPTEQQRAVIEAEVQGPVLVVAGAGSGKTETMANRVLWLLANGLARPDEILGLTFTRKAAGELGTRIRQRIAGLESSGIPIEAVDEFDRPVVATYNSFANTLYRDNASLIGRESDGSVLGEASAWQLARSVVLASSDERLVTLGKSVDVVTRSVLSLARAIQENLAEPEAIRAFTRDFSRLVDLPPGGRGAYAAVEALVGTVGALDVLLDLASAFEEAKRRRGLVEYSDQVALALQIVRGVPRVREELRERHRIVLLDEYQDTSVVQTWLLSELFGDHSVTAVGDPNQAIYGWRGASAANLAQFASQFGRDRDVPVYSLSTSWRNGHGILRAANTLVRPLLAQAPRTQARVPVARLEPGPSASAAPVDVAYAEDVSVEARAVADWLEPRVGADSSAAILFRTRSSQRYFIQALRERGIPFHVLGIGGLLEEPEIADLVAALRVISDPTAGSELVRLLAGSRWRVGTRDLHALGRLASWLRDHDYAQRPLADDVKERLRSSVAEGEGGSIVDALDFIASARPGHSKLEAFSEVGLERLADAARTFRRLRGRAGLDLLELVTVVEQDFQLDIEVAANDSRSASGAAREAFFDALSGFLAVDENASLAGFLSWLREAEWRDNLAPRPEKAEPGTVQLLTIHGSKGLEWDNVVVPRLVAEELPARPREGYGGWLGLGSLPYDFRGDAAELPAFAWRGAATRKELVERRDEFARSVRAHHEAEERRLAYVAVTRARHGLLLSGSFWATQSKPRQPSPFLVELVEAGLIGPLPIEPADDTNPLGDEVETFLWPRDPLGGRRERVAAAAERVRGAEPAVAGRWAGEIELLLAERAERLGSREGGTIALPTRVPASRFKDYVSDPASVAASLRRPMPERPYRATRLGTFFHSWVESRYGMAGGSEAIDALLTETDDGEIVDDTELTALQATFERSPWAARRPIEVEREIHLVLDDRIVVCKIDAVYQDGAHYEIVDWKTGRAPKDAADLEAKQYQLALYRLAYARWKGIDPGLIDAVFYFVADDAIIRPERLFDETELIARWREAR